MQKGTVFLGNYTHIPLVPLVLVACTHLIVWSCQAITGLCPLQVHTVGELERVLQLKLDGCMLGINNRDLGTFQVDLNNNKLIMQSAPGQQVCCSCPLLPLPPPTSPPIPR